MILQIGTFLGRVIVFDVRELTFVVQSETADFESEGVIVWST